MLWVPPASIDAKHLEALAASLAKAPEFERLDGREVVRKLYGGNAHLFAFKGGLIVVEVRTGADGSKRLSILGFAGKAAVWRLGELVAGLRKLAADWACDMIETCVYDLRLARAIERVGGSVESVNLMLRLEG